MPTIGGQVLTNARRVPDREALVDGDRRWTWSELDADVARVAGLLAAHGVEHGDRVGLLIPNSAEHVLTVFASHRLGAIVVPLGTRLAAPEIRHIVADSDCELLVHSPEFAEAAITASADLRAATMQAGGPDHPDGLRTMAAAHAPLREDRAQEHDDAVITYTSGTTGRPKGVLIDHHRAIWAAMAQVMTGGMRDGDRYLHMAPLYHSGGVVYLNATTMVSGTHVIARALDAAAILELLERERIAVLQGVPTLFRFMLAHPDAATRDLSSLRIAMFGGAPMPAETVEALLERFPNLSLHQLCGQTEAGPTGLCSDRDQLRADPLSTGHQAQPMLEAQVVDEHGAPVGPGEVGELVFRGEAVMKGYWNRPVETAETVRGGWLHTGDLMRVNGDGGMTLVDRLRDVVITGGRNVYSAEVEQALAAHPGVKDCAVIGRPHPDWGATVVAVVDARDGHEVTLDGLREVAAPRIADYKLPRDLVLADVPRNGAGKLQKHLLRSLVDRAGRVSTEETGHPPCQG